MLSVLLRRNFGLLWLAGLISITGGWMLTVALPIAVYELTGSATAVSGIVIARTVPAVALSSIAGVFVDRWDRKQTMVIVNVCRGLTVLLMMLVDSADDIWILYIAAFLSAGFSQFFGPAENALLPRLVEDASELPTANSLNALNNNLAGLIGPAIGGILASWGGLRAVAIVDSFTFLLSAALIAGVSISSQLVHTSEDQQPTDFNPGGMWRSLWKEWVNGLAVVYQSRFLKVLFIAAAILAVGNVGFTTLLAVFVSDVIEGGAREMGWLHSGQAVGGIAGALFIGSVGSRVPATILLGVGLVMSALLDMSLYLYPALISGVLIGVAIKIIDGVPVSAINAGAATMLQTGTSDEYRGRVFGALGTTMSIMTLAASPISSIAADWIGVVAVLVILAFVELAAGVVVLRYLRAEPQAGEGLGRAQNGGFPGKT